MKSNFAAIALAVFSVAVSFNTDARSSEREPASSPRGSFCSYAGSGVWVCFQCRETVSGTVCMPKLVVGTKPFDPTDP